MGSSDPITIQPTVRTYAESLGQFGRHWLDRLPAVVQQQTLEWDLQLGLTLAGGSRSYVRRATTRAGREVILKISLPEPIFAAQVATLNAARGRGYVHLLADNIERGALLLESLGSDVGALTNDVIDVLRITGHTLMTAWQVAEERNVPAPNATEHKAAGLLELVRELSLTIHNERILDAVDQALHYARVRLVASDPTRQVIVHGDPHAENLLQVKSARIGAETGFVFIDPEGFRCEPEYDLGVALRDWNSALLASPNPHSTLLDWCEQLAQITSTNAEAIWQWAYLERVSTGLYLHHHGLKEIGDPFLTTACKLLEE
jgi:streptomycin 6-kinase